jgi:hypothetical protein
MAADWSSLPSDLVHRIGDCLLATNDIDCYIDMRVVCHGWRSATAVGPRAQDAAGAAADPRFLRPHQWTMLDEEPSDGDDDGEGGDARLFLNLSTGCFLRRRVPLLRDKILVVASESPTASCSSATIATRTAPASSTPSLACCSSFPRRFLPTPAW